MSFEVREMMAGDIREGLPGTRKHFGVWHVQVTARSLLCQEHDGTGNVDQGPACIRKEPERMQTVQTLSCVFEAVTKSVRGRLFRGEQRSG